MTYTSRITITATSIGALREQIAATIAAKAAQGEVVTHHESCAAQSGPLTAVLTFGAAQ